MANSMAKSLRGSHLNSFIQIRQPEETCSAPIGMIPECYHTGHKYYFHNQINVFIGSLSPYLLSAYFIDVTVPISGSLAVEKTKSLPSWNLNRVGLEKIVNKK